MGAARCRRRPVIWALPNRQRPAGQSGAKLDFCSLANGHRSRQSRGRRPRDPHCVIGHRSEMVTDTVAKRLDIVSSECTMQTAEHKQQYLLILQKTARLFHFEQKMWAKSLEHESSLGPTCIQFSTLLCAYQTVNCKSLNYYIPTTY